MNPRQAPLRAIPHPQIAIDPAQHLERGRQAAKDGEVDLALIEIGIALRHSAADSPVHAAAASDIGVVHYHRKRPDLAKGFLSLAVDADPTQTVYRQNLELLKRELGTQTELKEPAIRETGGASSVGYWVQSAIKSADIVLGFRDKDVIEIGGALPPDFVRNLGARTWTSVDPGARSEEFTNHRVLGMGAESLPIPPGSFDVAFSSCAFEHVPDLSAILNEIHRVLRPGGVLYTEFSPIWSCLTGHHIWVQGANGKPVVSFADGTIPRWAHLIWTKEEFESYLRPAYGDDVAKTGADNVYVHDHLNRLFEDDYYALFDRSPFLTQRLEPYGGYHPPPPQLGRRLREANPGRESFCYSGFRAVLRKRPS